MRHELGFINTQAFADSSKRGELLVARDSNGEVVGFARFRHWRDRITTLYEIGVARQGVGLGGALIGALEREASRAGSLEIRVKCPIDLPANEFYSGLHMDGVQISGSLRDNYSTAAYATQLKTAIVLAAQFESWRDPLIILVSVPMSIFGAMVFLTLGFASVNIYTQVGLITLIGLIAKNGILIVEFANQLRIHEGLNKREAVVKASRIRLRPILMTTLSMVVAMVPLLIATGPGAVSRFHIGLVIATGLGIGTIFTLYVVPAFYMLVSPTRDAYIDSQKLPALPDSSEP